jgi:hypothetical protein
MASELLLVVPVRGRPANLGRLLTSFARTGVSSDVVVAFDSDDVGNYDIPAGLDHVVLPDMCTSAKLNAVIMPRSGDHQAVMMIGDDHLPREQRWDEALLDSLRDLGGTGFVQPETGSQRLPGLCLVSTDIVRLLGWYACPRVRHYHMDDVWHDLGSASGSLRFCGDVHLEHMRDTAPDDQTYQRAIASGDADARAYRDWAQGTDWLYDLGKVTLARGIAYRRLVGFHP